MMKKGGETPMDSTTQRYIDNLAEAIVKAYDITIPIHDIDAVVQKMGGVVKEQKGLDDLYDGTICKTGRDSFSIVISPFQSQKRKVFTVAHELGHLFLHMGFQIDPVVWENQDDTVYRRFGSSEQEYQANEFAAALLMPRKEYVKVLKNNVRNGRVDISAVASYFHVSNAAAGNRGRFLGYLI